MFDNFMSNNDFTRCSMDHYFYTNTINMALTILFLYIDDMLIMRLYIDVIKEMKE